MGIVTTANVSGRQHITLRIRLKPAAALQLQEIADAERRTPEDQAAYMLERELARLAATSPDEQVYPLDIA